MSRALLLAPALWLAGAGLAQADLSARDAWAVWRAQFTALGFETRANPTEHDGALTTGAISLIAPVPGWRGAGGARLRLSLPSVRFAPLGDGTVEMHWPSQSRITLAFEPLDAPGARISFDLSYEGRGLMSGTPGRVESRWQTELVEFRFARLVSPRANPPLIEGRFRFERAEMTRVTEIGERVQIGSSYAAAGYTLSYEIRQPVTDWTMTSDMAGTSYSERVRLDLPRDGLNLARLGDELDAGAAFSLETREAGSRANDRETSNGKVIAGQDATTLGLGVAIALDASGAALDIEWDATGGQIMESPMTGFAPVTTGPLAFGLAVPLRPGKGTARIEFALADLMAGDALWKMFDPEALLPRGPIGQDLRAEAGLTLLGDPLEPGFWARGAGFDDKVTLDALAIERFAFNGLGITADATGEAVQADPESSQLTGRFAGRIAGVDKLLDKLIALDVMTSGQAAGLRLGLGLITRPAEDGTARDLEIELTPDGQIKSFGRRIR